MLKKKPNKKLSVTSEETQTFNASTM